MDYVPNIEGSHLLKATMRFFLTAIGLIILPILTFEIISTDLSAVTISHLVVDSDRIIAIGGAISTFVAMEAFFPKVSAFKMIFGVSGNVLAVIYFWSLLGKGIFDIRIGGASFHINVTALSSIILCSLAISCLIPVSRFISARKECIHDAKSSISQQDEMLVNEYEVVSAYSSEIDRRPINALDPPPDIDSVTAIDSMIDSHDEFDI